MGCFKKNVMFQRMEFKEHVDEHNLQGIDFAICWKELFFPPLSQGCFFFFFLYKEIAAELCRLSHRVFLLFFSH